MSKNFTNMDMQAEKNEVSNEQWNSIMRHFIGNNYRYRENIIIPKNLGPIVIKTNEEKMVETVFESCPFKSVMSCVIGKCELFNYL